ncbi:DUF3990 domain-containing protein [Paraclostridium bifermentans]|uniref:DUF3990 domain-containing protein n=1 Tax=Paraclostridium bifermentans TaxID=1490 RepID=UPI00374F1DF0
MTTKLNLFESKNNTVELYHTGTKDLKEPKYDFISLNSKGYVRAFDFGIGFYATPNFEVACNWLYLKTKSQGVNNHKHVNKYELNLDGLKVYKFESDEDWLDFVLYNRSRPTGYNNDLDFEFSEEDYNYFAEVNKHDVIIGRIADDSMYEVLGHYTDGNFNYDDTIDCVKSMDLGLQYILRSQKAIDNLTFIESFEGKSSDIKIGKDYNDKHRSTSNEIVNNIFKRNKVGRKRRR